MKEQRRTPPELWRPLGVAELEPGAWQALKDLGCTSVSAGPGSGKTEFLAQRAGYLLHTGICPAPQRILAISFKRDSAANLARRVLTRLPQHADRFDSMTFDAFAKSLVDRFGALLPTPWARNDAGHSLRHYSTQEMRAEHAAMLAAANEEQRRALMSIDAGRFLSDAVGVWTLPADSAAPPHDSPTGSAAWCWWHRHYLRNGTQVIDFTMINRLADLLVRHHPPVALALRVTYPFVFVDEFQDTTNAQFSLLENLFHHPSVQTTAVGDGKQKIMGWAGALPTAMEQFESTFGATHIDLQWNFRSSEALVAVQHRVASELEPGVLPAVSKAQVEDDHLPAVVLQFANITRQAEYLAHWISDDISNSGRTAADFAILGKQMVGTFEQDLRNAFARHSLSLRNDTSIYGGMYLQDLVKHPAVRLIVGILRLATQTRGLPGVWNETLAMLMRIRGEGHSERAQRATADRLVRFTEELRTWLHDIPLVGTSARTVVDRAASIVNGGMLAGFIRTQHEVNDAQSALAALALRIDAVVNGAPDWGYVINEIGAQNAVTLQTIHRSKGLEYHTVVVLGLDEQQWWSYKKEPVEATAALFVGLSRAAHRLIFTCTDSQARLGAIRDLYELLDAAGVPEQSIA